ncbi:hypothetical protein [Chachezhania sediminis]|uniref:hypothetical protein n=1 Tax=Chachezhania sediminis TaxID=2599291 RepID=UPI00131E32EB|nr:hypothetical protein [Chachezhania sediminis]
MFRTLFASGLVPGLLLARSPGRLPRDGSPHKLDVLIDFDGQGGGFDATVWLDGTVQLQGRYQPSARADAYPSKYFYFKHGVYSPQMFDYVLTSTGMTVKKVRLKK